MDFFSSDQHFDQLYPPSISALASRHWTPLAVAKEAAAFLAVGSNTRILDIGSGVGKFCMIGAQFHPHAVFTGVEQRDSLTKIAQSIAQELSLANTHFLTGNFTEIDFTQYHHFYFYNAFYENLIDNDAIDQTVEQSPELFNTYNRKLYKQLKKLPAGTRIATFHSSENEMPSTYQVVGVGTNEDLKFWIKL
ncbi:MAG: methyltransferase domain-containing protein [Sediminibacterium sp.]